MKALITLPVRDHINPALRSAIAQARIPFLPLYGMSDLPRARSLLVTQALKLGAERILFIDADIVPTAEEILLLAEHPRVARHWAVTGLYPLRSGKAWACHAPDETLVSGVYRRAEYAGLGFACISRESLLAVKSGLPDIEDPEAGTWWPFCVPVVRRVDGGKPEYGADDVSLWWRLADVGVQLWADTRLVVGHQALFTLRSPVEQAELGTRANLDELGAKVHGRGQVAGGHAANLVLHDSATDGDTTERLAHHDQVA